jgi:hypothetical protein
MNFNASVFEDFFNKFRPGGPWMIYARSLDEKGAMLSKIFTDVKEASAWAAVMNSEQNPHQIYFQINPTNKQKKPKDADITRVEWLQVDVDPWKDETADEAFVRIAELLTKKFPKQVRPPTLVVFSGGGFQAYWRMAEPIELDGSQQMIDDIKGYNRALAALLDGDHCFDVCRVFRAPGSVNWPSEKKRKRGQKPQLAEVQFWDESRAYKITDFVKADVTTTATTEIVIPDEVPNVDLDDLVEYKLPDKCLDIIVNGPGPEHASRSEAVWYVSCEMVRHGVPDHMIYGVLSNSTYEISEHILAQVDPRRSAIRHIERAHEYAEDADLAEMNEKYAVVSNYGGKCLVMYERHNFELDRPEVAMQAKSHFFDATAQMDPVEVGSGKDTKYIPRAKWWWVQKKRRQYESVVFAPGRETPPEFFNLFRGFAFDPSTPGGRCEMYLDHVRENVCQGNQDHYDYLIGWMARAVQEPGRPAETAVVLQGDPGTGKSFFATHFGAIFGRHYVPITDSKHLLGSFNAHLQDCIVLFADEAFSCRDVAAVSRLKGRITEPTITIEKKGIDAVPSANCLHIIMASNEQWVVPVEHGDRRFFVLQVGTGKQRNAKYFGAIASELADNGYAALLCYLQNYDLSAYDVREIPWTEALREQKICTLGGPASWWFDVLCRGSIAEGEEWVEWVPAGHMHWDYYQFSDVVRQDKAIPTVVGLFLRKALPKHERNRIRRSHESYNLAGDKCTKERDYWYRMPSLDACRAHFDEKFGGPYEWPDVTEVQAFDDDEDQGAY